MSFTLRRSVERACGGHGGVVAAQSKFAAQVAQFSAKAIGATDKTIRNITRELFNSVILMSPVGDPDGWKNPAPAGYVGGRFRGNWQTTQGAPADGTLDRIDASGSAAMADVATKAGGLGSHTFLANNLPYAQRLEYESWSKQAPAGMVRVTFARITSLIEKQVRANKV